MMTTIKNVSIIGLGALGILYGHHINNYHELVSLTVIANEERIQRYEDEGIYCNGDLCEFTYKTPETISQPADLIIVAVKYGQLSQAIHDICNHVGDKTIIVSVLNGIVSELDIAKVYGDKHIVPCVAQGMDATKDHRGLTYTSKGVLCFGSYKEGDNATKVKELQRFFDAIDLPYVLERNMSKKLWNKFMANVGINQVVAMYKGTYKTIQEPGQARDMFLNAMEEVRMLSVLEEVNLGQKDIDEWVQIMANINPDGMPSMRQDMLMKRYSELDLFAGTVIELAKKHDVEVPVNQYLYDQISNAESKY